MPDAKTVEEAFAVMKAKAAAAPPDPAATTGACVYNAGSKTYCAVLTKADCDKLGGAWVSGGKCP